MSNLSQVKRDRMRSFLEELKQVNTSDGHIKAINEIENFLDEKRYGLVWEEHAEQVDLMMRDNIPVFTEDQSKKIIHDPSKPVNFILEGDNLHSLYLLEKTHKNLVDVIYIDPPYNTNNKDFLYDDSFVDKEDSFRNSKWLSFMEKRLRIAKSLLRSDGVIFVSIDENESANLELLLDDIFGVSNKLGEFIWKGRSGKGGTNSQIAFQHEYIKVYAKNAMVSNFYQIQTVTDKDKTENLRQWGDNGPFRSHRPTMFFPVLLKENKYSLPLDEELLSLYDKKSGLFNDEKLNSLVKSYSSLGYTIILPKRDDSPDGFGRWRQGIPGFKSLISANLLTHSVDMNGEIVLKKVIPSGKESTTAIDSILDKEGTSSDGTKEIKRLFGKKVFDTTKPVKLIKYLLFLGTYNKPKAVILDFFAGSGTTGEAVAELNKSDNGSRQFILGTNNEGDIAEKVTYPRMKMVSEGYKTTAKYKEVLYEEKLTPTRLKKMSSILDEIEEIRENNLSKFLSVKIELKDQIIRVIGEREKNSSVPGKELNVKYFKTKFIPRLASEDNSLTDELLDHIKEMAELDFSVDLASSQKVKFVKDETELDEFFSDESYNDLTLLVPTFVLLKGNQEMSAKKRNISLIRVPDYYFAKELMEAGEL